MINFLSIQALLNNLPLACLFIACYVVLCVLVGRWDYRRGSIPIETGLASKANPFARAVATALYHISRGEGEEAERVLASWLGLN